MVRGWGRGLREPDRARHLVRSARTPGALMWGGSPARFGQTVGQLQSMLATISFP